MLLFSTCLAHKAHRCLRVTHLHKDLLQAVQLPVASLAFGIVDGNGEIRLGGAAEPLFNLFPGGQPVAQADDREIMGQGRPQHRAAGAGGGQAGHHFNFRGLFLPSEFKAQCRHAIYPAVPGADHGHILPLFRLVQGHPAALGLPGHAGGEKFFIGIPLLYQIHIDLIAHDHLGVFQRPVGPKGHILFISRADAHNRQFQNTASHSSSARATVTPSMAVFSMTQFFPSSMAARWHTLSTPVTALTRSDAGKSPGTRFSSSAL